MEDKNICAICRDDEIEWDFLTRCGHYYHRECLQIACFDRRDFICPYCRTKISSSRIHEAELRNSQLKKKLLKDVSITSIAELKNALKERPDLFQDPQRYHNAFIVALQNSRRFMINFLISLTPCVNFKDPNGRTVLMVACWLGSLENVKKLVEGGADINAKDNLGNSVLVAACKNRKLDIVEYLIDKGADIYSKNIDNLTVLHWCGYSEIVEYFLKRGFDFSKLSTARIGIYEAAYISGNTKILEILKESGEAGASINELNFLGQNALFRIPRLSEGTDFLKMLLNSGINPHLIDKKGQNALCHYISHSQHGGTAAVKVFLEAGIDVNEADSRGMRPVHLACLNDRNLEILKLFYNSGARFDIKNSSGLYPYDLVLESNPSGTIQDFLENYQLNFSEVSVVETCAKTCEKCGKHHTGKDCPKIKKELVSDFRIKRIY